MKALPVYQHSRYWQCQFTRDGDCVASLLFVSLLEVKPAWLAASSETKPSAAVLRAFCIHMQICI